MSHQIMANNVLEGLGNRSVDHKGVRPRRKKRLAGS